MPSPLDRLKHPNHTCLLLLMLLALIISGCGSSDSDTSGASSDPIANSDIFGVYEVNVTIGECDPETFSITIGNNLTLIDEDQYIYLADDGALSYAVEGFSISRSGYSVTITETESGYSQEITLEFSEDLTSGNISGTIVDNDAEACSGTLTGTFSLITRNPAEISFQYLQFRTYTDSDNNRQAAWMEATKDGLPVTSEDLLNVRLYKKDVDEDNLVGSSSESGDFSTDEYYTGTYNTETGNVDFSDALTSYAGMGLNLTAGLGADDYVLVATFSEGGTEYQVSKRITYPGDSLSPIITNISAEENKSGDLVISWDPLSAEETRPALRVNIIKTDYADIWKDLLNVNIASDDLTSSIAIPADRMDAIETLAGTVEEYGVLAVQIQTRAYSDEGMNVARGYSDLAEIEDSSSGTAVDNTPFYGVYALSLTTGECTEDDSLTIGNDESLACLSDYIYLPETLLTATGSCGTIERSGSSLILTRGDDTLRLDFNQDKDEATLSGNKTTGTCTGDFTGTAELITRTPMEVQFSYITSVYDTGGFDKTVACIALTEDGSPIASDDIVGIQIYNSSEALVAEEGTNAFESQSTFFGTYDIETNTIDSIETLNWGSMVHVSLDTFPADDYTFFILTTEGYTVSNRLSFQGEEEIPVISDTLFQKVVDGDDVTVNLSWTLPEEEFDELFVTIMIKNIVTNAEQHLLTIRVDPNDDVNLITLPEDIEQLILDHESSLSYTEFLFMELQTRNYASGGLLYSSGFSSDIMQTVTVPSKSK